MVGITRIASSAFLSQALRQTEIQQELFKTSVAQMPYSVSLDYGAKTKVNTQAYNNSGIGSVPDVNSAYMALAVLDNYTQYLRSVNDSLVPGLGRVDMDITSYAYAANKYNQFR
ncbi:hypothetical protein ACFL1H_02560 [Nanoarchaeota archaeon]